MRGIAICLSLFAASVQAQTVECPKFYPSQDTALSESPYQHKGKGLVKRQQITGASAFIGEINDGGEIQGNRKDLKGGYDVELPVDIRWFVCEYGNNIQWWEELKLSPSVKSCTMQVRESKKYPLDARLICK